LLKNLYTVNQWYSLELLSIKFHQTTMLKTLLMQRIPPATFELSYLYIKYHETTFTLSSNALTEYPTEYHVKLTFVIKVDLNYLKVSVLAQTTQPGNGYTLSGHRHRTSIPIFRTCVFSTRSLHR
jgi:hypothetical protein